MTGVCGRLITPGWVFSNLFNGGLLEEKTRGGGGRRVSAHPRRNKITKVFTPYSHFVSSQTTKVFFYVIDKETPGIIHI